MTAASKKSCRLVATGKRQFDYLALYRGGSDFYQLINSYR